MSERKPQLRVPGKLYLRLCERARCVAEVEDPYELDLADVVSRARVVRKGGGYQAFIPADPEQVDRLAMWVKGREREDFRAAADNLRDLMAAES